MFYIFKRNGVLAWLFLPMLINVTLGQLEAWLLIPLYWLLTDAPHLAGFSAALLTLKPQLAVFVLPYMLYKWWHAKDWAAIRTSAFAMGVLYIPTFFIDPLWMTKVIPDLMARVDEPITLTRNATIWSWWWRGTNTTLALVVVLPLIGFLAWRAWRVPKNRAKVVFLLSLIFVPVHYAVTFISVLATLKNTARQLYIVIMVGWIAWAIDFLLHQWGGIYITIPIAALALLSREPVAAAESPPQPEPTPAIAAE